MASSGHDLRAGSAVIKQEHETIAQILDKHGYGPSGKPLSQTDSD